MRTLALGFDGCSWNILEPLLESGELPNISALRKGLARVLESTIPFYTGPAWASFATGASPGRARRLRLHDAAGRRGAERRPP